MSLSKIRAYRNTFEECSDGAVYVGKSAANGDDIEIYDNKFIATAYANTVPQINIGSIDPTVIDTDTTPNAPQGAPTNVKVHHNEFNIDANPADMIRVSCAIDAKIYENTGKRTNWDGSATAINFVGAGFGPYTQNIKVYDNDIDQLRTSDAAVPSGQTCLIRWGGTTATGGMPGNTSPFLFERNRGKCDVVFAGAAIDNPNVTINRMRFNVTAFASGVYPLGQFVFSYEADYDPPSLAAGATDTLNLSVPGVRKGDAVYVDYSTIGAANFQMTWQANANNNVRIVRTNMAASATDLVAGKIKVTVTADR